MGDAGTTGVLQLREALRSAAGGAPSDVQARIEESILARLEGRPRGLPPALKRCELEAVAAWFRRATLTAEDPTRAREALDTALIDLATATPESNDPCQGQASRYRAFFDEVPLAVLLVDGDGRVVDANPAYLRLMGYDAGSRGELVGRSVLDHPLATELGVHDTLHALLGGEPFELRRVPVGPPHYAKALQLNVRGLPLPPVEGSPERALLTLEDVTAEASLGEQLVRAQKMESLGTLAGGIAHEFNNLLSGILGHASLLRTRIPTADPLQRHVTRVEEAAHRAAELTQQLMAFSRDGEPDRRVIDVGQLVHELGSLLERSLPQSIRVLVDRPARSLPVLANRTQLQQALLNVCTNARDAMTSGGELRLAVTTDVKPPHGVARTNGAPSWVHIRVLDSGHGMEEEIRQRVFDPFFTTKAPGKGTGLGLAITYRIVNAHAGTMDLRSTPGEGTAVDIWLPTSSPQAALPEDAPRPIVRGSGTILLVDDEPILLELMSDILGELGYDLLVAEDGIEAMDIYDLRWRTIDLVVLDVVMPRMGGRETLAALRSVNPDVRVILCSGYLQESEVGSFPMAGVQGFLRKPYDRERLADAVSRALGV